MAIMTARDVALHLLERVECDGAFVDRILTSPEMEHLSPRDRALVREIVLGVLRWKSRLDRIIDLYYTKKTSPPGPLSVHGEGNKRGEVDMAVRNAVRLGLFQVMFLDSIPDHAAVSETVSSITRLRGKGAGGLANALLRRFIREGEPGNWPSEPAVRYAFELSHPGWLVQRWIEAFGADEALSVMRAGNERRPVFVRPGHNGVSPETLAASLALEGFESSVVTEMPGWIEVSGPLRQSASTTSGTGFFETAAFNNGLFAVQDPPAGMASLLLSPRPGEHVLDLCAAPGGKTTHLALLMEDRGRIRAVDLHEKRLGLVREAARRLGYTSIVCETGDAKSYGRGTVEQFDRVLLDVPCSGTGVFSKRPDLKWRVTGEDVSRLSGIQRDMLENAARLVREGGVLVYSTCTLEHEENEDTVQHFIDGHPEFIIERDKRFERFEHGCGYLMLPHQMMGTGAFAALLRRR